MKKIAIAITFMFLTILTVTAQENNDKFWDNVLYGGGFNVGFGSDFTTIAISPSAIYNFSDVFSSGVSLSYLYSKNKFLNTKANVYGGCLITLFNVAQAVQLSAEFEELNINVKDNIGNSDSYWNPALYLGAAYNMGNVSIGLRYDALYDDDKSIYSSAFTPVFRFYF
jgi:long-subunit fatty acid transport protein